MPPSLMRISISKKKRFNAASKLANSERKHVRKLVYHKAYVSNIKRQLSSTLSLHHYDYQLMMEFYLLKCFYDVYLRLLK